MSLRRVLRMAFVALAFVVVLPGFAWALDAQTLKAGKGLDVWYVSDHTLPMIAMSATLPAGSAYDPADKPGLAAFAAYLLNEGAGKMKAQAFQSALNSRGIRLSVSPGRDVLHISLVTLTSHAPVAFRLLGLALSSPRFDADAVARVRSQILASLEQGKEDPGTVAARAFYRRFFHDHAYGHPVDGDAASIGGIDAAALRNFAKSHWVRGHVEIAVSGDVDGDTLKSLIASAFGKLPDAPPPPPPPVTQMGAPGLHVVAMDVPQPSAVFGLPGLKRSNKDFIAATVANYILGGGGFSSRLMNEVREKRGLTYGISTGLDPYKQGGVWLGEVASKTASLRQVIDVVRRTMKKFVADGPTQKELTDAKTYLTGSFPLAFTSNVGIAHQLNVFQTEGLGIDYVTKRNALINAVTAADVRRVAARLFDPAKLTVVVAGSLPPPARKQASP